MRYFISGHRDITIKEFQRYYAKAITNAVMKDPNSVEFVVGDYYGVDAMAQEYLAHLIKTYTNVKVTVYHMFDKPRNNFYKFPTKGGYTDDHARDSAMTLESDADIAWVRSGKQNSGTEQNIVRRKVKSLLYLGKFDYSIGLLQGMANLMVSHPDVSINKSMKVTVNVEEKLINK